MPPFLLLRAPPFGARGAAVGLAVAGGLGAGTVPPGTGMGPRKSGTTVFYVYH